MRMFDQISNSLSFMEIYATQCHIPSMLKVLFTSYSDVLDFYCAVRNVFIDRAGNPKSHASLKAFFHAQWKPFEAEFGEILNAHRDHNLDVLQTAEAEMFRYECLTFWKEKKRKEKIYVLTLRQRNREMTSSAGFRLMIFARNKTRLSKHFMRVLATGYSSQNNSGLGSPRQIPDYCGAMASVRLLNPYSDRISSTNILQ